MSGPASGQGPERPQNDRLLWLAAAVVGGIAVTWLAISLLGPSGDDAGMPAPIAATPTVSTRVSPAPGPAADGAATGRGGLADPLRVAELAFEAGMLIEPEDYSAWTLYKGVLDEEPGNEAARVGLGKVAAALLPRGAAALEQGRFDDAQAVVDRILDALPEHADARALGERIEGNRPKAPPPVAAAPPRLEPVRARPEPPPAPEAAPAPRVVAEPPKPEVDRAVQTFEAFELALRENRLLTPADDSARFHVETMMTLHPTHALTADAQRVLTAELLRRAAQALDAQDAEAATTWIDQAERVSYDDAAITSARSRLEEHLIAVESSRPLPASALTLAHYVAPEYPRLAVSRQVEGWVDLLFVVAADGTTRDVRVSDASQRNLFDREAISAVEQWRFEPRRFMGRTIEQNAYTTIRFALAD